MRRVLLSCLVVLTASIAAPVSAAPDTKPSMQAKTLACKPGLVLVYRVGKNTYPAGSPQFERAARAFSAGSTNLTGTFGCTRLSLPGKVGTGSGMSN